MMLAEPPPAIVAPADEAPVIEVVATRSNQAQKIDRRTYRVSDNPQAAQSDTLQLLRGLPAVVVTPDDQLLLLGSGGVTVLVDERPIQGDVTQYLRTLHGSDIERIEIITNPSAQYAANGSGGIINLVLRRKRADGVTGSASLLGSSHGRVEGGATVKIKRGDWGFELQAQSTIGHYAKSRYERLRSFQQPDGSIGAYRAEGDSGTRVATVYLNGKASYDLSPRTTVSLTASGGFNRYRSTSESDYLRVSGDFDSFSERYQSRNRGDFRYVQLDYDHKGKIEGETLKASVSRYTYKNTSRNVGRFDDGGGYTINHDPRQTGIDGKIDWVHPIGKSQILSVGGLFNAGTSDRSVQSTSLAPGGILQFTSDDSFKSREFTAAAYATYQLKFGKLTLLPGLRVERFDRKITSPGRPSATIHRTALFPSFHLDRPFGKDVTFSLSYSRRIDRPDSSQLRPYLIRRGALSFDRGNPDLRDQTNDNFEMNLHYRRKKFDLGLIVYDRETTDLWDYAYVIDADGNSISSPINAGHKSDRGAQVDLSSPLFRRVKGSASFNLFNSVIPLYSLEGSSRFSQLRYTANATIDWQGRESPNRPGDIGQVQLVYDSPSRNFQYRNNDSISLNLSYTRSLSKTLALTASLNGIGSGHSTTRLVAPAVQDRTDNYTRQPDFKLKLVKTFAPKR